MAVEPKSLVSATSSDVFAKNAQMQVSQQETWKFAAAASALTLGVGAPVGFNKLTGNAGPWTAPDPTKLVVDTGGATGGTFTVTVNGNATGNIAYNATVAVVADAIRIATGGVKASVTLATGIYTILFDGEDEIITVPTVTGDVTGLTGGTGEAATPTAGTSTNGLHKITGFVWPEPAILSTTGEKLYVCAVYCKIDYNLIATHVDSGDLTALIAACQTELLPRGIVVDNLGQVR